MKVEIEIGLTFSRSDSFAVARSEKALNKRNDVLIGSFTVTCTPTVRGGDVRFASAT